MRVGAEKIEEIRLRRGLVLLRLLRNAEQEIEQAFGGSGTRRKHNGACDRGGDKHQAAPLALNRQLVTQRFTPPDLKPHLLEATPSLKFGFTIVGDGKRAVSGGQPSAR